MFASSLNIGLFHLLTWISLFAFPSEIKALKNDGSFHLVPQVAHEFALNDIAHAADHVISVSYDRIVIWEIASEKAIEVISDRNRGFSSISLHPQRQIFAVGARDKTISLFEYPSGNPVATFTGHNYPILDLDFNHDGSRLISVASLWDEEKKDKQSECMLWDTELEKALWTLADKEGVVEPIRFSPDGQFFASGSIKQTMVLWDAVNGKPIQSFGKYNHLLKAIAFSPDGARIAASVSGFDRDKLPAHGLLMFDRASGEEIQTFSGYPAPVDGLDFSPDGSTLVTAANGNLVYFPDPHKRKIEEDKKKKKTLSKSGRAVLKGINHLGKKGLKKLGLGDFERLLPNPLDIPVRPLNNTTSFRKKLKPMKKFLSPLDYFGPLKIANGEIFNKKQGDLALRREQGNVNFAELCLWDTHSGRMLGNFFEGSSPIYSVAFSPDGRHVVADGEGRSIQRYQVKGFHLDQSFTGLVETLKDIGYSPDGRWIYLLDNTNSFRLWNAQNLRKVRLFRGHSEKVTALAFSEDGKTIASASLDKSIKIWDVDKGHVLLTIRGHKRPPVRLAFIPGTNHLVSMTMPTGFPFALSELKWWDATSGLEITQHKKKKINFKFPKYLDLQLSPDGRFLALSKPTRKGPAVEIWDVPSQKKSYSMAGVSGGVFCDHGSQFLILGKAMKVVDVETNSEVRTFESPWKNDIHFWENFHFDDEEEKSVQVPLQVSAMIGISPDYSQFASYHRNAFKIWDLKTGNLKHTQKGRFNRVRFHPKGKNILTSDVEGRLQLWGGEEFELLATFLGTANSEEFILLNADNYYLSTGNGYRAVSIVKDQLAYSFDQFDLVLNRPDKLLETIPGANREWVDYYRAAYKKRLEKMGVEPANQAVDLDDLPKVEEINLDPDGRTDQTETALSIRASDPQIPLRSLNLWVNGVPIHGWSGWDLSPLGSLVVEKTFQVPIIEGRNKIQVAVRNERGLESRKVTRYVHCTREQGLPDLYLLAIGVDHYQNLDDLEVAAKDAHDLVKVVNENRVNFSKIHTLKLVNHKATRENILKSKSFLQQARERDQVWVFAAGHGLLDQEKSFYFATPEMNPNEPEKDGVLFAAFEELFDGIPSRKKLFIIDACFSGEIDKQDTQTGKAHPAATAAIARGVATEDPPVQREAASPLGSFQLMQELFVDLRKATGTTVLTSARGTEQAMEDAQLGNGLFTHALLKSLQIIQAGTPSPADRNGDLLVNLSELQDYCGELVTQLSHGRQHPSVRRKNLDTNLLMGDFRPPNLTSSGQRISLGMALRESFKEIKLGLVKLKKDLESGDWFFGTPWKDKQKPRKVPPDWNNFFEVLLFRWVEGLEDPLAETAEQE